MGNLPLDPGKYAVNVQWYNQRDIGSSLEYRLVWATLKTDTSSTILDLKK